MLHLDTLSTLVAATMVLLLGRKLVQNVPFLKKYTIPEPVAGGLLVALALLVLKKHGYRNRFRYEPEGPADAGVLRHYRP